jgi:hypothetical protein
MKSLVILVCMLVPALALAQPSGSAGSGSPAPTGSAGSAGSTGSGSSASDAPAPPPTTPPDPGANAAARKACTDAMNADPTFEKTIVDVADQRAAELRLRADQEQHQKAATAIDKNERHVIMAYAAMWIIAALFVMFLWRRQAALRLEIAQLKTDLDAATRAPK